jgi:3-oxoacyl-[acyl-carrier protein] reductase
LNDRQRVALVTGSSRGIGRAIALRLAARGARLVINYLSREDEARKVVAMIEGEGGAAVAIQADITQTGDVERLFQQATEAMGQVEILVNNAGIIKDSLLVRMSDTDWDSVMNLDLRATFLCTRVAVRSMLRSRWGRIINIGSVIGLRGNSGQANYAAAKAGVVGLTQSVAREVASRNITVNYVAPGYVETDIVEDLNSDLKRRILSRVPMGRFGRPEEIASMVAFLASDDADYITSQMIAVDGGMMIS